MKTASQLRKFRQTCERSAGIPANRIQLPLLNVLEDVCRSLRSVLCSHRIVSPSSGSDEEYPPDIAAAPHLLLSSRRTRTVSAVGPSRFHRSLSASPDGLPHAHLFVQAFSDSLWVGLLKMVPLAASPLAPFLLICLSSPLLPAPTPQFELLASR